MIIKFYLSLRSNFLEPLQKFIVNLFKKYYIWISVNTKYKLNRGCNNKMEFRSKDGNLMILIYSIYSFKQIYNQEIDLKL